MKATIVTMQSTINYIINDYDFLTKKRAEQMPSILRLLDDEVNLMNTNYGFNVIAYLHNKKVPINVKRVHRETDNRIYLDGYTNDKLLICSIDLDEIDSKGINALYGFLFNALIKRGLI